MGGPIELRCRCGEVRGTITGASPRTVNRVTCYCDDCQAFAHQLGRADLLNDKGGSDVVQVAPATLRFTQGQDRIAGVRLSPKGLYRWHTTCCNTPVGNTLGPAVPFVGLTAQTSTFRSSTMLSARRRARSKGNSRSANHRPARPDSTCRSF